MAKKIKQQILQEEVQQEQQLMESSIEIPEEQSIKEPEETPTVMEEAEPKEPIKDESVDVVEHKEPEKAPVKAEKPKAEQPKGVKFADHPLANQNTVLKSHKFI